MKPSILVIDDQEPILDSFAALLDSQISETSISLDELEAALGGTTTSKNYEAGIPTYDMHYARQGLEGVRKCEAAIERGTPFSVAFVDVHMPPGIDGVDTALALWKLQPDLEIVLCTAHAIYSWREILEKLPRRDQLVILRKPFDAIEVRQLAACLSEKARRGREIAHRMAELEARVQAEVARRMETELAAHLKFEELGKLAAGMAHEISTPVQYIQSSLDFLGELVEELPQVTDVPLEDMQSAIRDATGGVARITAIVRSVREYSHVGNGGEPEPIELNALARMAAELARSQYKYDAQLVLDLADDVAPIQGFPDELGRAIMNLIVNASHAIRAKTQGHTLGTITVTTRATAHAVTIAVGDTGTGVAPEHRAKIFEPFFTTKPRGVGTGQGLPLVRATVERHGGTIHFDTAPGVGTTFILTFPLEAQHAKTAAA